MSLPSFDEIPDDICQWCGKCFTARSIIQKFCCVPCQRASVNKFKRDVEREERRLKNAGKTCKGCGKQFDAREGRQAFCEHSCMASYHDRRHKAAIAQARASARVDLKCEYCGTIFSPPTKRRYCCRECIAKASNRAYQRRRLAKSLENSQTD